MTNYCFLTQNTMTWTAVLTGEKSEIKPTDIPQYIGLQPCSKCNFLYISTLSYHNYYNFY